MNSISTFNGYIILALYGLIMLVASIKVIKKSKNKEDYLVANREIPWHQSGFSIAATWIWAPALFIATQKAYTQGIAGLFWFTVPNILCLLIFSYFAIKIRKLTPNEFTLSSFIKTRYSKRVQYLYLIELFGLAICQFAVQLLAGGAVIHFLTGIDFFVVTLIITLIALSYSLISGIRASIFTDYWQMWLILIVVLIIVPWTINESGGFDTLITGIGGLSGKYYSPFNSEVAYSFGIAVTIGLLAGPFGDQSFWQRTFATKKNEIKKSFYTAAVVFGVVPLFTGMLGFIAAAKSLEGDPQLINIITVQEFLPSWVIVPFSIMLLSGLISTLDSALCAASSLMGHDLSSKFKNIPSIKLARLGMVVLAILGLIISNIPNMKILYLFLFYGTLRASTLIPTILTIIKGKLSEKGMFYGISTAIFIGAPIMAYGNFGGGLDMKVFGSIFTVASSGIIVYIFSLLKIK